MLNNLIDTQSQQRWNLKFKFKYKLLFEIFYALIRYSGISYVLRELYAKNRVTIIVYHNPDIKIFEKHLTHLLKRYSFISMSDLSDSIYKRSFEKLPKYPLLITIDDGWKENYSLLEILKKIKVKPTIFITSHLVNTNRNFWTTVCNIHERDWLKRISNEQRLKALSELYEFYPEKEFPANRQVLNQIEIDEMKNVVDFGLHSCFHPNLTRCTSNEKFAEINECKRKVEEIMGFTVETFAFPNGFYDNECIDILRKAGIAIGRTTDFGRNDIRTDPFKLKATGVSDNGTINKLVSEMTGIPYFLQQLIHRSFFRK